jgi:hypothetical protein
MSKKIYRYKKKNKTKTKTKPKTKLSLKGGSEHYYADYEVPKPGMKKQTPNRFLTKQYPIPFNPEFYSQFEILTEEQRLKILNLLLKKKKTQNQLGGSEHDYKPEKPKPKLPTRMIKISEPNQSELKQLSKEQILQLLMKQIREKQKREGK